MSEMHNMKDPTNVPPRCHSTLSILLLNNHSWDTIAFCQTHLVLPFISFVLLRQYLLPALRPLSTQIYFTKISDFCIHMLFMKRIWHLCSILASRSLKKAVFIFLVCVIVHLTQWLLASPLLYSGLGDYSRTDSIVANLVNYIINTGLLTSTSYGLTISFSWEFTLFSDQHTTTPFLHHSMHVPIYVRNCTVYHQYSNRPATNFECLPE
ncbi:hypothetical protein BDQ17DRAFT_1332527 [Cyathus striatus]|nr:hypothetical protein BDQ17DRAFT_1332527 [Cyathus striatus]